MSERKDGVRVTFKNGFVRIFSIPQYLNPLGYAEGNFSHGNLTRVELLDDHGEVARIVSMDGVLV